MDTQRKLLEAWPGELARTLEMMTGAPIQAALADGPVSASIWWQNRLTTDPETLVRAGASREAWSAIGGAILEAAGLGAEDESEVRGTWVEVLDQAASGLAGVAKAGSPKSVESQAASEVPAPGGPLHRVVVDLGGKMVELALSISSGQAELLPALPAAETTAMTAAPAKAPASRTMDALLDVQLPVSISFGHARMPLKDVLKLTTGTVVELNRQPEDPVDIIVNDCVIARGEVVVMDGNYAVRIQSIIGRQDRLGLKPARSGNGRQS